MTIRFPALRVAGVLLLIVAALAETSVFSQERRQGRRIRLTIIDGREAADGEVIIQYRNAESGFERERAEWQADADDVETIGRRGLRRMHSRRHNTRELLALMRANPDVEFVEPNWVLRADTVPNDPSFGNLWGLLNSGQNSGTPGADIDATRAWEVSTGSRSIVVGVIDTGIDYNHADLAANMWRAPSAFSVTIGGMTVTCPAGSHGFNAINNTCNPMDDNDHGTHVSGTIGGVGNNSVGVAGVSWTTSLMALKFLDAGGSGYTSDAVKAIEFAIQAKAAFAASDGANVRVLSNSWSGGGFSQSLLDAINRANSSQILFVAAAGNSGDNNDFYPAYPASYTASNIVAVAATDRYDRRASFSNYGAASVHLGAPGVSVYSTTRFNSYASYSGTSMATPHVAGAAALLLAACDLPTTAALKSAILTQVDPVSSMSGVTTTGGRLNVNNAIRACPPRSAPAPSMTSISPATAFRGQTQFTLTVTGSGFTPSSEVRLDGGTRATQYQSATQISATITAADVASLGSRSITVFNAAPGGGTSTALTLAVVAPPLITLDGSATNVTVAPGGSVTVAISGSPGHPKDWLGWFSATAVDSGFSDWAYTNGLKVAPSVGVTSAALNLVAPAAPGNYEVRLFSNNSYVKIATSATITVAHAPSLTINDVSVMEGNSGTRIASFTATLSSATQRTVTATFSTVNGSATGGSDFAAGSGTITFGAGVTTQTVAVVINGDMAFEPDETLVVVLSNVANAVLADDRGAGTIVNDDASVPVTVSAPASPVAVGGAVTVSIANGPGNATDWVGLYPVNAADSSFVAWAYLNGQATPPSAGLSSATLQFVAPPTPGAYNVRLFSNNSYARLGTSSSFNVVNGQPPTLTISDVGVAEGNSGNTIATFTVTLSPPNQAQTVTVAFATADGSASAASDYLVASGVLTFSPSVASQSISITVRGDTTFEPAETFVVNLSNATNAVIGDAQGTATISNDDSSGTAAITLASAVVAPGGNVGLSIANGPANATDWIGMYRTGAADVSFVDWSYWNGSKQTPSSGSASATLQFAAPAETGSYEFRFFSNNSYAKVVTSEVLTVAASSSGPLVIATTTVAVPGAAIGITIANGPANATDWVGLFPLGAGDNSFTDWSYFNGLKVRPVTGSASATLQMAAPPTPGSYEIRLFANNTYTRLATSGIVTVSSR